MDTIPGISALVRIRKVQIGVPNNLSYEDAPPFYPSKTYNSIFYAPSREEIRLMEERSLVKSSKIKEVVQYWKQAQGDIKEFVINYTIISSRTSAK